MNSKRNNHFVTVITTLKLSNFIWSLHVVQIEAHLRWVDLHVFEK